MKLKSKLLIVLTVVGITVFGSIYWDSLMNNLSRGYEIGYLIYRYDYREIDNSDYIRNLSFKEKVFCHRDYHTEELIGFIKGQRKFKTTLLHKREGKITEKVTINGCDFVIKTETTKGFLKNLFMMNRCVCIWNNGHFAKEKGILALKPIALVEKRGVFQSKSSILYLLEGIDGEKEAAKRVDFFDQIEDVVRQMKEQRIIHQDFRLKNLVVLPDNSIQLIDIDKIHQYPKYSYVYHKRLAREIHKFNSKRRELWKVDRTLKAP